MNSVQALTGNTVETNLDTDEDANQTQQSEKDLHNECHGIQMQILGLLSEGVSQHYLTDKDRLDYMGAISLEKLEEGGAVSWEQKKRWLEDNMRSYVPHFLSEARHMTDEFMGEISKAKKQKWISSSSAERWRDRLFQRSTNWAETKSFLIQFKKGYMENWKKLSEKRKTIEGKKKELKVTAKEVPELKLLEKSGFDELHFFEKMRIASEALVALNMYKETSEHKKKLYEQAKKMMNGAIKSRFIRQDRAMKWIEDLFSSKLPAEKIEQNINGKMTNYIGEWTKVKYRYDRILRRMEKGVPPGTEKLNEQQFLNLLYKEKMSYVEEAEHALNLIDTGFSSREIDGMKLEIRSLMAQKDWEGAKEVLKSAKAIAQGEDIYELDSMDRFIKQFSSVEEKETANESAANINEDIRRELGNVPASIQKLYIQALQYGPQVFASLCTLEYNRTWCWNNGYLDAEKEDNLYNKSFKDTEEIVENGHKKRGLENINLDIIEDNEKDKAMRPYENTWAPTIIHMDASDGGSCNRLLNELKGKERARDYWTSLIVKNITYEKQRELTLGTNRKMKSSIRKLHAKGFGFSLIGDPISLN